MRKLSQNLVVVVATVICVLFVQYWSKPCVSSTVKQTIEVDEVAKGKPVKGNPVQVPDHVTIGLHKLYHEMKENNMIVDDSVSAPEPLIPNIFHFVRFKQPNMKFFEMLAVMSALKAGNAEAVYIHCDEEPKGRFWDMIRNDTRIEIKHTVPAETIFGKKYNWIQHISNIARMEAVMKYGGIYIDNDCIVLNDLYELRKHRCVAVKNPKADLQGNMIIMGVPNCPYHKMWMETYRLDYHPNEWYYNGGHLPQHAILDQYPGIAYIADYGGTTRVLDLLFGKKTHTAAEIRSKWNIIHLLYRHKEYIIEDHTEYDDRNIHQIDNGFTNLAKWILYE